MRLRPILACLAAIGAVGVDAPAAQALEPITAGVSAGVVLTGAAGLMARRDSRNGLICLNYRDSMPTRARCGFEARSRFYEAARAPERPIGPVSWLGPGYAPPTRPAHATRVAAPGGCGDAGRIAPCGLDPHNSGYRR